MPLTTGTLKAAYAKIAAKMDMCASELNALDGKVGDGDLGITMARGAREVMEQSNNLPEDLGMAFLKTAQAFTMISGSTFGTLIATGLMAAAKRTKGRTQAEWLELGALLEAAVTAMAARGKANLGDKTVLDALDAVRVAVTGLDDPQAQLAGASRAIDATLAVFRDKPNKVGRARIFAGKTVGLDDPGMVALRRVVDGLMGL